MFNNQNKYPLILFILIAISYRALADDTSIRSYELFNNGRLQLNVSDSWRDKTEQALSHLPPTIIFTPLYDDSFHISISPMWAYREGLTIPDIQDIKQLIGIAAENAKGQAVENSISTHEFKNTENNGYYYSATDKAPKPGEYKYMTQGMIKIGDLFTTFTILTNDDSVDIAKEALMMLSGAVHSQNEKR